MKTYTRFQKWLALQKSNQSFFESNRGVHNFEYQKYIGFRISVPLDKNSLLSNYLYHEYFQFLILL